MAQELKFGCHNTQSLILLVIEFVLEENKWEKLMLLTVIFFGKK